MDIFEKKLSRLMREARMKGINNKKDLRMFICRRFRINKRDLDWILKKYK